MGIGRSYVTFLSMCFFDLSCLGSHAGVIELLQRLLNSDICCIEPCSVMINVAAFFAKDLLLVDVQGKLWRPCSSLGSGRYLFYVSLRNI